MMRTGKQFKGVRTADLSTPTSTPRFITYKPPVSVQTTPTTSVNLFEKTNIIQVVEKAMRQETTPETGNQLNLFSS